MCDTVDVFAGNYTIIDWELHELWLNGLSTNEAIAFLREGIVKDFGPNMISQDILASDVNDHYRLFDMLENVIITSNYYASPNETPFNFSAQFQFIDESTKERLIESYYDLDGLLCREIVGKKLSSRLRKDLDEICDKLASVDKSISCNGSVAGLRLKSARRQFDNVKRVFKTIEEMAGDYVTNIKNQFGLSQALAERYATLVFAASFRFEMSKRRLNYLNFDDVIVPISLVLIDNWMDCGPSLDTTITRANSSALIDVTDQEKLSEPPTLDKDFLTSLRDLKALQERDKEHRNVVCSRLQNFLPPHHTSTTNSNPLLNASGSGTFLEEGDDSSKSSKQSSRKSSSIIAPQTELFCDRILSYAIPRNHSGVSAGTHSQTSTVVTSTPSELGSQYLSSQKAYTEFEGNFKLITRGIVSLATGLSHNKEVKDFFVQLVEKVVEPLRSLKTTRNDVNVFLRQYTLAVTEAGLGSAVPEGDPKLFATLLMDNEVRLIFARFMNILIPAVMAAYPT